MSVQQLDRKEARRKELIEKQQQPSAPTVQKILWRRKENRIAPKTIQNSRSETARLSPTKYFVS